MSPCMRTPVTRKNSRICTLHCLSLSKKHYIVFFYLSEAWKLIANCPTFSVGDLFQHAPILSDRPEFNSPQDSICLLQERFDKHEWYTGAYGMIIWHKMQLVVSSAMGQYIYIVCSIHRRRFEPKFTYHNAHIIHLMNSLYFGCDHFHTVCTSLTNLNTCQY